MASEREATPVSGRSTGDGFDRVGRDGERGCHPLGICSCGPGGFGHAARLEECQRLHARNQHQLGWLGKCRHRRRHGCLTLEYPEVFQAVVDAQQDQRNGGIPLRQYCCRDLRA
jgi:hypothetical protein